MCCGDDNNIAMADGTMKSLSKKEKCAVVSFDQRHSSTILSMSLKFFFSSFWQCHACVRDVRVLVLIFMDMSSDVLCSHGIRQECTSTAVICRSIERLRICCHTANDVADIEGVSETQQPAERKTQLWSMLSFEITFRSGEQKTSGWHANSVNAILIPHAQDSRKIHLCVHVPVPSVTCNVELLNTAWLWHVRWAVRMTAVDANI